MRYFFSWHVTFPWQILNSLLKLTLLWSPCAVVSFLKLLSIRLNPIATSACSLFAETLFFLNPILHSSLSQTSKTYGHRSSSNHTIRRVRQTVVSWSVGSLVLWSTAFFDRDRKQSRRSMQGRIKEHERDMRVARTQTFAHKTGHYPIWNEVKFIDRDPH